MNQAELVDVVNRINAESFPPDKHILLNVECASTDLELLTRTFAEYVVSQAADLILEKAKSAATAGKKRFVADTIMFAAAHVQDMALAYNLSATDASRTVWSGYRVVLAPEPLSSCIQYIAPSKEDISVLIGRILVGGQEKKLASVGYHPVPLLRTPDPDNHTATSRYFNRLPPSAFVAEESSNLIAAFARRGWNLYQLRDNRIYSKSGPAQHLLVGDKYSIVPACADPTSAAHIMAARIHATETGQTFHVVSCPSLPTGFVLSGFSLTRQLIVFEPRENSGKASPYSSLLSCLDTGHWSSYDSTALPSRPKPSIVN